jgi:DNA-binding transcriptional LysR family regulator
MSRAPIDPAAGPDGPLLRLRFQHLRMIGALAESHSVHEAAQRMHLTQSAASKLLADLERAFDSRLFDRGRLGLHPTAAGQALIRRTSRLLRDVEAARAEQHLFAQGAATLLRVGGLPLTLTTLMPDVLERCRRDWPELVLQLREATGRQLIGDVNAGVVDCGLGRNVLQEPIDSAMADLWFDELTPEALVAVARPEHPLVRHRRVPIAELGRFEWITPAPGTTAYTVFAEALRRVRAAPLRPAVECDASFGTIIAYVRRFNFVGLLPRTIALQEAAQGRLAILRLPIRMSFPPVAFVCRRERLGSPEVARFHRIVRSVAGV